MKKNKTSSAEEHFDSPYKKKYQNDNPDKRDPNPDDPNEDTGPPMEETPIKDSPNHPHLEEILDGLPK